MRSPFQLFSCLFFTIDCASGFGIPQLCHHAALNLSFGKGETEQLSRRSFLATALVGVVMGAAPGRGFAAYGDSTNIEIPSYVDFLIEKNKVVDSSTFLYKGADPELILKRLIDAGIKLGEIPVYASQKKWSQVQGVLTGPLGTLGQTLNQVAKDGTPEVQAAAKKVKNDVILIGQASSKKSQHDVVATTMQAQNDLEVFVRLVFSK